jgi:hypothetical protein
MMYELENLYSKGHQWWVSCGEGFVKGIPHH